MKIHFSNVNFSSSSGPNTFAYRLAEQLTINGHNIVDNKEFYDIFLCFIEPSSLPIPGCKIIHRLDGIWFKPEQFKTHNKNIKWAYDNSHRVIWQSNFDRKMTQKWWGNKLGRVIRNGINLKQNQENYPELSKIKLNHNRVFCCSANWHRQKRLKENIQFFKKNSNKSDALIVLGNNPDFIVEDKNIYYMGNKSHDFCLQVYNMSDWFIHLAWLDHCPNVVVEALSKKCPVICTDSGGTMELVGKNGIIIPETKKYNFELTDYDKPYDINIPKINLSKKIDVKNSYLDIRLITNEYEALFKE